MNHSVYDFKTIRWLERHHNQKKISIQNLDAKRITQLKEMFDHLDADGSGTIEVSELQHAMTHLGLDAEQQRILEQFDYMDADHSGSIDFDEFVAVMTSDMVDQEFFQLKDEKEAQKWNLAFFIFATSYRRAKLIESISQVKKPDSVRYKHFHSLFSAPNLPSVRQNGSDSSYDEMKKNHQSTKDTIVTKEVRAELAKMGKRSRIASEKLLINKKVPRHSPPFHMHTNYVPRRHLGNFERGEWVIRNSPEAKTDAWNLVKNRSVKLETRLKTAAMQEAKRSLGQSNSSNKNTLRIYSPKTPSTSSSFRRNSAVRATQAAARLKL